MTGPAVDTPVSTDLDDVMERMIAETKAQSFPTADDAAPAPAESPARGPDGKFVAAAPAAAPDPLVEGAPAPAPDGAEEDAGPVIPDGYVAPPTLPPEKAKGFTVSDADGEILPPDLTWKLVANGKELTLSTDKLVSYAQMGRYNHELQVGAQQATERVSQVQRAYDDLQTAMQTREQQIEALLSDPDYYARAADAFAAQNTPEHRAQREREQLAHDREQLQMERASQQASTFIDRTMAPALEFLQTTYSTISRDEIAAKFFLAARPYVRNGVLMPEGFAPMQQWALHRLEPELRQLHEHRSEERAAPAKAAATVQKAAQIQAQKAKSLATRAVKPAGRAMPESAPPVDPSKMTLQDAEDFVYAQTKRAMAASG